jgi:predicted alpha/beta-fold hydrolase
MFDDFIPHERLTNGHAMTLWAWARPRKFPALPPPESRVFDVASDARVLAHCHWQHERTGACTIVVLHGLEGSSEAHYMRGIADKAWARGFNVVRLNQRNCGGTEHLSATLYHSGLSEDVEVVMRTLLREGLSSFVVAGYSLGGNLALKLAGEHGAAAPGWLRAVAAVSPVMDLPRCVAALERGSNFIYQWNFVRNLKARMRRKAEAFPDRFSMEPLARIRTVRDFDEAYTAPFFGFRDATDYYYRAASLRVVDRISVPALIITSADDPFVPSESFTDRALEGNPSITVRVTPHGGHCAFVGAPSRVHDGYWAEWAVTEFLSSHARSK